MTCYSSIWSHREKCREGERHRERYRETGREGEKDRVRQRRRETEKILYKNYKRANQHDNSHVTKQAWIGLKFYKRKTKIHHHNIKMKQQMNIKYHH